MKKVIVILVIISFLVAIPGISIFSVVNKPLKENVNIEVEIKDGDSFYSVLDKLKEKDVVKSLPLIKVYTKITNSSLEVVPGVYNINSSMSLSKIIKILKGNDKSSSITFTVQEGYNIEDIAIELESLDICTKEEFIDAVKKYKIPKNIVNKNNNIKPIEEGELKENSIRYSLEGYLYPNTYKITKGVTPDNIIELMLDEFEYQLTEIEKTIGRKIDYKNGELSEIITIASMIENETRRDDERGMVSAVIKNRMKINMPLRIDATVNYANGEHSEITTLEDLEVKSAYNTYAIYGLPIGPICNPRKESIVAAINPDKESIKKGYLYYILEPNTDKHFFTKSDEEFMKKREEWGYNDI